MQRPQLCACASSQHPLKCISSSPHRVVTHEAGNEGARLLHIEQLAGSGRVGGQQAAQAQRCRRSVGCPAARRRQAVLHGG